tara:strand:- start:4578 stop:5258 length:681 start_codon:yes stop_codon:yes gene_type:complete
LQLYFIFNTLLKICSIIFLIILSAFLSCTNLFAISIYTGDVTTQTISGDFYSTSGTYPLRNEYKYYIGELSYDWLSDSANQSTIPQGWTSLLDGWDNDGIYQEGDYYGVHSYWETQFYSSFSFSLPENSDFNYVIAVYGPSTISQHSELVPIHDEMTGGNVIDSITTSGNGRYVLDDGGIYSVSQQQWGPGAGQSSVWIYLVVPEPSTYALILGGLVLGFVALRRK